MREIEFRYTFKRNEDGHIYQIVVPLAVLEDGHGEIFTMLRNDLWTLVARDQWTGLHDREGREIWEGDIVRFCRKVGYWSHDRGEIAVVRYIAEQQAQYCGFGFSPLHPLTKSKAEKVEVIGNVHEHPDMVK